MDFLVFSLLNGIVYSLLLFLVASGLTLVFGMMGIINFAHGAFYMLGAYFALELQKTIGFFGALLVAPLLVALIGVIIERFILRKVHAFGHGHELLVTFGLAFVFEEAIKVAFGNRAMEYGVPDVLRFDAFSIAGLNYPFYRVFVAAVALALFAILFYVLRYTRAGLIVRAAVRRPVMVSALGHNVAAVQEGVFGLGAWMAGVAGAVGGALLSTSPMMATQIIIPVFVVIVVGGMGSLTGALLASLLVGVLTSLSIGADFSILDAVRWAGLPVAPEGQGLLALRLSSLSGSMPILIMLLVLLFRPAGLMGERA